MGLFRKKKEPKKENVDIGKVLETIIKDRKIVDCPDVMIETASCYCIGCSKLGTCAVERMSKSTGCVGSFAIYCSCRDNNKNHPTVGWADIALRNYTRIMGQKFGLADMRIRKKEEEELIYGEKERKIGIPIGEFESGPDEDLT